MTDNTRLENTEGTAAPEVEALQTEASPSPVRRIASVNQGKKIYNPSSTKCLALIIVSLLLILLTLAPIGHTVMRYNDTDIKVQLNLIDGLKVFVFSGMSNVNTESEDYLLFERYGYPEKIDSKYLNDNKMAKTFLFLELQRNYSDFEASLLILAIFLIVYAVLCIVLFANCIKMWILQIKIDKDEKEIQNKGFSSVTNLLTAMLLLAPLMRYAIVMAFSFGTDTFDFVATKSGASFGFALSVIILFGGVAIALFDRISDMLRRPRAFVKANKKKILTVACLLLICISMLLPVIVADYTIRDGGMMVGKLNIGMADVNDITDSDIYSYYYTTNADTWVDRIVSDLFSYGYGNRSVDISRNLLHMYSIGCGRTGDNASYILFYLVNVCALAIFAMVGYRVIKIFLGEAELESIKKPAIFFVAAGALQIILTLAMISAANSVDLNTAKLAISFSIGLRSFLAIAGALAMILLATKKVVVQEKVVDRFYDNPDVSYAPYVVGYESKKK